MLGDGGRQRAPARVAVDVEHVESQPGNEADIGHRLSRPPSFDLAGVAAGVLQPVWHQSPQGHLGARLHRKHGPATARVIATPPRAGVLSPSAL